MTTKRMLIDASHPEETRVAIVSGHHLEDFDVEVESRKQLRGNIYLAKVTRVEPSLQAAFVDYGGNRHGFLAFSEIHPDYYQIPVADREALLAEQQEAGTEAEALEIGEQAVADNGFAASVETVGGDDTDEVQARRPVTLRRKYKIQEVIKRRQILLIQVVKEERGTKGAALTTYLSLAGRYCVLMPNTARGGGISRKIGLGADRKHLKSILNDLGIPKGMAVIVRTAGQNRSKAEIKRDYEYLMRVWNSVRDTTLESMAPCLVHEEGNLVKRSIRDLYDKDIDEIIIDGDASYRTAKDFMKLLIPSHTKRVQPFKESKKKLFQEYGLESQLDSMHSPNVQMKSGGYIVINPTEALVSIDVNSGRSTRGRNIEETALKTNLEAADEVARQLKLRDLSGLIVIDFIDMEDRRNQGKVERRLKDAMRSDRARIQIGRISPFGLMELSRQRLRPSLIETSSDPCPYCEGTGIRRSTDSAALHLLRALEDEGMHTQSKTLAVFIPTSVALYILNNHRAVLAEIEAKCDITVTLESDDTLIPPNFRIEGEKGESRSGNSSPSEGAGAGEDGGKRKRRRRSRRRHSEEDTETSTEAPQAAEAKEEVEVEEKEVSSEKEEESGSARVKRRRRGRRGGRRRGRKPTEQNAQEATGETPHDSTTAADVPGSQDTGNVIYLGSPEGPAPEAKPEPNKTEPEKKPARQSRTKKSSSDGDKTDIKESEEPKAPAKRTRTRKPKKKPEASAASAPLEDAAKEDAAKPAAKPRRASKHKEPAPVENTAAAAAPVEPATIPETEKSPGRKGWWSRSSD